MVFADRIAEERFSPNKLAKALKLKSVQNSVPNAFGISKIKIEIDEYMKLCNAERLNIKAILDVK